MERPQCSSRFPGMRTVGPLLFLTPWIRVGGAAPGTAEVGEPGSPARRGHGRALAGREQTHTRTLQEGMRGAAGSQRNSPPAQHPPRPPPWVYRACFRSRHNRGCSLHRLLWEKSRCLPGSSVMVTKSCPRVTAEGAPHGGKKQGPPGSLPKSGTPSGKSHTKTWPCGKDFREDMCTPRASYHNTAMSASCTEIQAEPETQMQAQL